MRRLLIVIAVLVVLFVVVDRLAAYAASQAVAAQVQRSQNLASKPRVTIGGFPFLPQASSGKYRSIDVRIDGLRPAGLRIAEVDAHLHGVRVSLGNALSGNVKSVPVESVDATALLAYADLSRTVDGIPLSVTAAANGEVRVSGQLSAFGVAVPASALCTVSVDANELHAVVRSVDVAGVSLSTEITSLVRANFGFTERVPLPFGLHLTGVRVAEDGIVVSAAGAGLVLR